MENLKAKIRHFLKTSLYTEANAATLYKICLLESTIFLTPSVSPSIRHIMVITAVNTISVYTLSGKPALNTSCT